MRSSLQLSSLPDVARWFSLFILRSITFQSPLVRAQDGGGQTYELVMGATLRDTLCLGNAPE